MTGIQDLRATRDALRGLARIAESTRQSLAVMLRDSSRSDRRRIGSRSGQLADTLEHIGDVREGFILSQRTSPHISLPELRALVQHILLDWNWLQEMNLALAPSSQIEILDDQLVAYNHALVALAVLPGLPAEAITFPQPQPTYGDVTAPVLPGDLLARIEEIEQIIYQIEVTSVRSIPYAPFRRTYAFFEASSWLVNKYLEPLLGD